MFALDIVKYLMAPFICFTFVCVGHWTEKGTSTGDLCFLSSSSQLRRSLCWKRRFLPFSLFARPLRVKILSTSTAFSATTPFPLFFFFNATGTLLESWRDGGETYSQTHDPGLGQWSWNCKRWFLRWAQLCTPCIRKLSTRGDYSSSQKTKT